MIHRQFSVAMVIALIACIVLSYGAFCGRIYFDDGYALSSGIFIGLGVLFLCSIGIWFLTHAKASRWYNYHIFGQLIAGLVLLIGLAMSFNSFSNYMSFITNYGEMQTEVEAAYEQSIDIDEQYADYLAERKAYIKTYLEHCKQNKWISPTKYNAAFEGWTMSENVIDEILRDWENKMAVQPEIKSLQPPVTNSILLAWYNPNFPKLLTEIEDYTKIKADAYIQSSQTKFPHWGEVSILPFAVSNKNITHLLAPYKVATHSFLSVVIFLGCVFIVLLPWLIAPKFPRAN